MIFSTDVNSIENQDDRMNCSSLREQAAVAETELVEECSESVVSSEPPFSAVPDSNDSIYLP